uniref:AlNc14C15G1685 protein n=1 Tax=Albugo laibachii Nc14 TaxID=890382 RepID=F0W3Y6_9STRA|nr:AlNc14C15G1685 [Albugo laibachii Nc14]|eukprot:CCA15781.1 AlNc14C15G1685 [Albugo laibachii Nc14]
MSVQLEITISPSSKRLLQSHQSSSVQCRTAFMLGEAHESPWLECYVLGESAYRARKSISQSILDYYLIAIKKPFCKADILS